MSVQLTVSADTYPTIMAFVFSVLIHNNTNIFKRRLDAHWQDIMGLYDFCAQLQGIGSHSEVFRYE